MIAAASFLESLRYSLYLILHPFDGFWDLKHEKKGSVKASILILALVSLVFILKYQYTGFLLNLNNLDRFNMLFELSKIILPFLLWCVSNWCLTTLMDGEGSFKDIFIASAYALVPVIIIQLPLILVSRYIIEQELAFYKFFSTLSLIWAAILIFVGTMTTHQYTLGKTAITTVFIIVGMGIMIFIGLLFFSLIQEAVEFVISIYREITFRL